MTGVISEKAQAILDQMKPLGEFLGENQHLYRVLGRTAYAEKHGYDALKEMDRRLDQADKKFRALSSKYRKQRAADDGMELL